MAQFRRIDRKFNSSAPYGGMYWNYLIRGYCYKLKGESSFFFGKIKLVAFSYTVCYNMHNIDLLLV